MATTHQADAKRMLDDRGYTGQLVRGQNPAQLMEKAVRDRITESYYWKEQCFGLNEASLCDRAVEITHIGGVTGTSQKPTPFLCLAFKLLQLLPERDIVLEFLHNEDFKYLRALAAFYVRLTFDPPDVYRTLEPLLEDYSKLKRRTRSGYQLTFIDQFVDDLLTKERVCATSLWKLPARQQLEDLDLLEERRSPLGEEIDEIDNEEEEGDGDGDGDGAGHGQREDEDEEEDGEVRNGRDGRRRTSEEVHG
ncbi:MAG: hypothetical protein M1816_007612 [Peltula sp. TS41687]|nr:MAG: hypothetical protein M1816_007612 [Peltula sp. TS41687]